MGRTVLVVRHPGRELWPGLGEALADRFRVIEPDIPAGAGAGWLADFVEGLGMRGIGVVAADPWCIAVLELARQDAGQFARVVLVPDGSCEGASHADAIAAGAHAVPLLVAPTGLSSCDALIDVALFLSNGRGEAEG